MTYKFKVYKFQIAFLLIILGCSLTSHAQKFLNKEMSITVNRQPISDVLKTISTQGGFYFSYNSEVVPGDSIVTVSFTNKTVKHILDALLSGFYQYKETGEYIILQRAPTDKYFYISGRILDLETGKEVDYASVYSRSLLVSALTDDNGNFRLKLRDRTFPITLTVSKIGYGDTSIVIQSETSKELQISIAPRAIDLDEVLVNSSAGDRTWLARLFVSSRLRAQSRNIGRFFVSLPYQASFTPGLGTHGKMSSQVVNKFSLNLLGGYTAGTNGLEIAGGFNIAKRDVRFVQLAGIFNIVSGKVNGIQMAGAHNHVVDSLSGVQLSGLNNIVGKYAHGVQVSGYLNRAASMHGVQVSGLVNVIKTDMQGVQISSSLNIVRGDQSGLQLAGVSNVGRGGVKGLQLAPFNYAKRLHGTQIGVINIADSSAGYSIGIINIVKHGTSNISVYANEIVPFNIAWKTGSRKIYSIITVGTAVDQDSKAYSMGFGLGKQFRINSRLGFITELTSQTVYLGSWENSQTITRLQTALNLKLSKRLSLNAGPSYTLLPGKDIEAIPGYKTFPPRTYALFSMNDKLSSWLGWQAGISWQYGALF